MAVVERGGGAIDSDRGGGVNGSCRERGGGAIGSDREREKC